MAQRLRTDWTLFVTVLAMVLFGLLAVYSASSIMASLRYASSTHYFWRQLFFAVIAFTVMMILKRTDYRQLRSPAWVFTGIGLTLFLLLVVAILDRKSHRWIQLGFFHLQPSEMAKPALALFLAYIVTRTKWINHRGTLLPIFVTLAFLAGFVVIGDLGTAMVLVLTSTAVLYVAGLDRRFFALGLVGVALFAAVAVAAKPYRLSRVIGYVDPNYTLLDKIDPAGRIKQYAQSSNSTRDPAYQAKQSRIAVGSGGLVGQGLMQGKQKLLYLPEAHTDFIYAVIGEELGFLGSLAVLAGFIVILWRGFTLFQTAPDDFGRYLALGITCSILIQALMNMSVVLDMGPTKGIPLPLISYGGSSLLSTLMSLGLLMSVSEHAQ